MADTKLSSSAVNSGTPVVLRGARITYNWNNYVKVPDIAGRLTYGDAPVTTSLTGWSNPNGVIEGIIDANETSGDIITFGLLKDFAKDTTNVYISDSQYYTDASYTTSMQIQSFNVSRMARENTPGTERGTLLRYSIKFVENP